MSSIPPRDWQKWDDYDKQITSDCPDCEFYRVYNDGRSVYHYCGVGVAFKSLFGPEGSSSRDDVRTLKLRRCDTTIRSMRIDMPSVHYLDEVIQRRMKRRRRVTTCKTKIPE